MYSPINSFFDIPTLLYHFKLYTLTHSYENANI